MYYQGDNQGLKSRVAIGVNISNLIRKEHDAHARAWNIVQEAATSNEDLLEQLKEEALQDRDSTISGVRADDPRVCLVCGFLLYYPQQPWGTTGDLPSGNKCPCCGAVFGTDDIDLAAVRRFRYEWLVAGAPWRDSSVNPNRWDVHALAVQMRNLPERVR